MQGCNVAVQGVHLHALLAPEQRSHHGCGDE
jgi:hypothetical protein